MKYNLKAIAGKLNMHINGINLSAVPIDTSNNPLLKLRILGYLKPVNKHEKNHMSKFSQLIHAFHYCTFYHASLRINLSS